MRLYLDEDSASTLLAQFLRSAGHDVQTPAEAGMIGEDDPVQFTYAIREDRVLLTRNHDDFRNLHNLATALRGHHPGLIVVCKENNPKRDLTTRGIIQAIGKLLASGVTVADQFTILNQWR
jgi:predicted nuclease of predicted toxin-antitoxin system